MVLYEARRKALSRLAKFINETFSSAPGISSGFIKRSMDWPGLDSFLYLAFADLIAWRISAFRGLKKYMTIFPFSVLKPKPVSSSMEGADFASSRSAIRKMSLTVPLSRKPGPMSCFLLVVICTYWLPTLTITSICPLVLDNLITGWKTYLESVTTETTPCQPFNAMREGDGDIISGLTGVFG